MRGLIYKEVNLFFKGAEKRVLIIAGVVIVFLLFKAEVYAGLISSLMLSMTIAIQGVLSFANDEKVNWKKYQMVMPISDYAVVASKYISIVYTLVPGIVGSIVLNLLSSIIYSQWDLRLYGLSVIASIFVPLFWAAICLPLTYWFGFRSAQMMSIFCIFPIFYTVKLLEDGTGWRTLPATMGSYILILCAVCIVLFILSYFLSVVGYSRKK